MKAVPCGLLSLCLLAAPVFGRQKVQGKQSPLNDGKLMYVGRMPENLDAWIINDLSAWGKYKPTRDSEGVDLVVKSYQPETSIQYEMHQGIPQPREVRKKHDHEPVMFSIGVTDWVTGRLVWQAEVLDRKPKRNEVAAPSGHAVIRGKGLSTQQLAQVVTRELRRYVDHLASQPGVQ
jgi:hypothetical protein